MSKETKQFKDCMQGDKIYCITKTYPESTSSPYFLREFYFFKKEWAPVGSKVFLKNDPSQMATIHYDKELVHVQMENVSHTTNEGTFYSCGKAANNALRELIKEEIFKHEAIVKKLRDNYHDVLNKK